MWGAGKKTQEALPSLGIRVFRDLRQTPVEILERRFGKYGPKMHQLAMGIDPRDVEPDQDRKSVGHEETFEADILDVELAKKKLLELAEKIARRMRKYAVAGRTITLKVKYSDFRLVTRATTLRRDTDDAHEIYRSVKELLPKTEVGRRPVRLLCISISQLTFEKAEGQLSLFGDGFDIERREKLHLALDSLYDKHGEKAIRPATLLGEKER